MTKRFKVILSILFLGCSNQVFADSTDSNKTQIQCKILGADQGNQVFIEGEYSNGTINQIKVRRQLKTLLETNKFYQQPAFKKGSPYAFFHTQDKSHVFAVDEDFQNERIFYGFLIKGKTKEINLNYPKIDAALVCSYEAVDPSEKSFVSELNFGAELL